MKLHFDHYVDDLLHFKRLNCVESVSLTDQNCIVSLCKLLECCTFDYLAEKIPVGLNDSQYKFLIKLWFLFWYGINVLKYSDRFKRITYYCFNSMIWSICGCVNEDSKHRINVYIRGLESVFPVKDTVYHYYVDNNYCKFKHWEEKLTMNTWEHITEYVSYYFKYTKRQS